MTIPVWVAGCVIWAAFFLGAIFGNWRAFREVNRVLDGHFRRMRS